MSISGHDGPRVMGFAFLALMSLTLFALPVVACGEEPDAAERVSLATLVAAPEPWEGERIEIQGELLRFSDPDGSVYGVVEDSEQHRVGLLDLEAWQSLIGQRVVAEGTLEFDASFGWYLEEPSLTAASP